MQHFKNKVIPILKELMKIVSVSFVIFIVTLFSIFSYSWSDKNLNFELRGVISAMKKVGYAKYIKKIKIEKPKNPTGLHISIDVETKKYISEEKMFALTYNLMEALDENYNTQKYPDRGMTINLEIIESYKSIEDIYRTTDKDDEQYEYKSYRYYRLNNEELDKQNDFVWSNKEENIDYKKELEKLK